MTVSDYLDRHRERQLDELLELLRIPSISTDAAHAQDVRRAAQYLHDKLSGLGFASRVHDTPRHPVVLARYQAGEDRPTVLVYGHYDVQPADPLSLWESDPFEPVVRDGKIVARGASDDKGQLYAHVMAAEALLESEGDLPVNLVILAEGEEEIGSPNLEPFIASQREALAADAVIVSDGAMIAPGTPTITYGLKGLCYLEVSVRTAQRDLHSGAYGGGVLNPIQVLAGMIARLKDEAGRVTVPGFYDAVLPIGEAERQALARVPFDEAAFAAEIGATATPGEAGYGLLERLWARPTLDANGIWGGFTGEGAKTVIPAEASAKLSCRLVPNQDHRDIAAKLGAHLRALAPAGAEVTIRELHGGEPALTPLESPAVRLAAEALEQVYGRPVVFARTGGSIPVVSSFQKLLGASVVLVGFGLETDRIHSPNESFDLENYYAGIAAGAALLHAFRAL